MTDALQIPAMPITAATSAAASITNLMNSGSALFQNPVASGINTATSLIPNISSSLSSLSTNLTSMLGSDSGLVSQVGSLTSGLSTLGSSLGSLLDHTNSLIFGGGSSILSGGLMNNIQQMLSGNSIKQLLYGFDALPFPTNCTQLTQFFGSLLGAGASMASGAVSQLSGISSLIGQATSLISKGVGALTNGISGLMSQATSLLSGMSSVASQITSQITSELGAFASLLNIAMNFIVSHSIANNFMNACSLPLMSSVGTPALQNALANIFVANNPTPTNSVAPISGTVYNAVGTPVIPSTTAINNILGDSLKPDPATGSQAPALNVTPNASLGNVTGFDSPTLIKLPIASEQPFVDTVATNPNGTPGVIPGSTVGVQPGQIGESRKISNNSGRC